MSAVCMHVCNLSILVLMKDVLVIKTNQNTRNITPSTHYLVNIYFKYYS